VAFVEITILEVDEPHIEKAAQPNEVMVPYVLSAYPPEEWKSFFEQRAPASANAKVVGNTVRYTCPKDPKAIKRYGSCWDLVTEIIEAANRYYIDLELARQQELGQSARRSHQRQGSPSEFEKEWDRYMSRD